MVAYSCPAVAGSGSSKARQGPATDWPNQAFRLTLSLTKAGFTTGFSNPATAGNDSSGGNLSRDEAGLPYRYFFNTP